MAFVGRDVYGGKDYQRLKRHYDYDDYAAIAFNATGGAEVRYIAGTNAFAAGGATAVSDSTIPMFEGLCVLLIPTVNCLVRFEPNYTLAAGASTRVQHLIQAAFAPYTFFRRFTALHVVGAVGAGTLYVHILG